MMRNYTISNILLFLLLVYTVHSYSFNLSLDDNYCLGSKEIKNINSRQKAFNHGPCSPIILVPGFLGTGLQVEINCQVLLENNPQIFKRCGWNTCNASDIKSFVKMPRKQYRVWIGDLLDKFSVIQTQDQQCLAEFLKFQPGQQKNYTQPKGLKITWVGNTPQTQGDSKCGASSVQNLLGGKMSFLRSCALNGFQPIIKMLQNMGYSSGINYQVIPYDFRKTVQLSQARHYIQNSIENLFKNTGKKVTLYGHSYGNLHLLKVLQSMKLEQKKQKINHFISIGAPYLGSAKAIKQIVGGDTSYIKHFLSMQLGLNYYSQQALTLSSRSLVHFLPRFNLLEFQEQKWFKQALINPPSWIPKNDHDFPLRDLLRLLNQPLLKVNNTEFSSSISSYKQLFKLFTVNKTKHFVDLIQQGFKQKDTLFTLQKPDVNTTIIFSSSQPTDIQYTYQQIKPVFDFKLPSSILVGGGDGTVSSISNIIPAIKWIYEKNEGGIKILNYGSQNKVSNEFYDTLQTKCLNKGNSNCQHSCFHQDPNILTYVRNIIISGQKISQGRLVHPNCQNLKIKNNF